MATTVVTTKEINAVSSTGIVTQPTNTTTGIFQADIAPNITYISGYLIGDALGTSSQIWQLTVTNTSGNPNASQSATYSISYDSIVVRIAGTTAATYALTSGSVDLGAIKFQRTATNQVTVVLNQYIIPPSHFFQIYNPPSGGGGTGGTRTIYVATNVIAQRTS